MPEARVDGASKAARRAGLRCKNRLPKGGMDIDKPSHAATALVIESLASHAQYLERIAGWHHAEWCKHRTHLDAKSQKQDLSKRIDVLKSHLHNSGIPQTLVACIDNQPVGSASIVYYRFSRNQAKSTWLTNVFVFPSLRGQGIGSSLVGQACEQAKRYGVEKLNLYTHDRQQFYQKRGWDFVRQGRLQQHFVSILEKIL